MSSFFAELKRRNVFKVGVAYAIVAWLLIQIVNNILPTFDAPRWAVQTVIFIILIGFPISLLLAWAYELTPEGIRATTAEGPAHYHTRTTGQRLNYFILGVLVLAVGFMLVDNYVLNATGTSMETVGDVTQGNQGHSTTHESIITTPAAAVGPSHRYYFPLTFTQPLSNQMNALVALSPGGQQLVYALNTEDGQQLQHRNLNQLSSQPLPLPTTQRISDLFFAPDGQRVGVGTLGPGALYTISLRGGSPQLLVKDFGTSIFGGYWATDGFIYFTAFDGSSLENYRIHDTGGKPEPVPVTGGKAGDTHSWTYLLPDGTHLLATRAPLQHARDGRIILVDLTTGEGRVLIQNGYHARYVPTGHIVFMRSGSLWAVPFDVQQLAITGPAVPVVQAVQHGSVYGRAVYAFSHDGLLVYLPGGDMESGEVVIPRQLVWVDRDGTETPLPMKAQDYRFPHLSPDETQVVLTVGRPAINTDVWTYDLASNSLSRRTFSGDAYMPLWTPDGTRLVYTFLPNWKGLASVKADGTGQPEILLDAPRYLPPTTFTPDGSQLIYGESITGPSNIYTLSLTGEHTEKPLLSAEFNEGMATLPPDGRWLAYESDETGQFEIYVRPYPDVEGGRWQVSTDGGVEPRWRGDGRELFYRKPGMSEVTLLAVPMETEQGFQSGPPVELFHGNYFSDIEGNYDVTADGQHFLFSKTVAEADGNEAVEATETNLVVVDNWFAELKQLAPPAQEVTQ